MKVLICVNNSIRFCPYAYFYINFCRDNNIDYCVLYPDRGELKEEFEFSTIRFEWDKKRSTAIQLLKYRNFASKIIKNSNYDYIMVLTTGAAVLLSNALMKKNVRYLVDVRDYTREHNWFYYHVEKNVLKRAECVFISSPEFRKFLPEREYVDVFNASVKLESTKIFTKKLTLPIVIAYIGTIAYSDQCERLMKLVEKDSRFRFYLYGNDLHGNRIENMIRSNNYVNSKYFGSYLPEQKADIINKSDILFNAYGNDSPLLKYALSNKLTDAAIYKKLVINSPGTYMNEMLDNCSYAIDLVNESSLDGLYEWYMSIEPQIVDAKLNDLLEKIVFTNNSATKKLSKLLGV